MNSVHPDASSADTLPSGLAGEPTWTPLVQFNEMFGTRSFLDEDTDRLLLRYYHDPARGDGHTFVRVWFGPGAEGPPGHAHGGAMAAVLDEAMGTAALLRGKPSVAAEITCRFLAMLPLGVVATAEAEAAPPDAEGRMAVTVRLVGPDGTLHAEGTGTFAVLGDRGLARLG
ncbi:MAG: PaaI family thioesterase [Bacteroidota bacterium]